MNFKQIIRQNYQLILERLDCSYELLAILQRNEAIQNQIAFIKLQQTASEKTDALLSILLEVPDDHQESVVRDVIEALKSSGQGHIANIFSKVSDKVHMSSEHYRQLRTNMKKLCQYMDPENGLLDNLFSNEVFSCSEVEYVHCSTGRIEMARKMIRMLMKKSDDAFETLIKALNEAGQAHVTYILTGHGNARPLSQKLRDRLMLNRVKLINSIYFSGFVSVLMSKFVFTEYDQQRVDSRKTENAKIEETLDLVARKSQSAFSEFIIALCETQQEHIVTEMMGSEIKAKAVLIIDTDAAGSCTATLERELREMMQSMVEDDKTEVKQLIDSLDSSATVLTDVEEGSIVVKFRCKNVEALHELHRSGKLDRLFTETFCRPALAHKGLISIRLQIANDYFQECAKKLKALRLMTPEHRDALMSSAKFVVHMMTVSGDLLDRLSLYGERRRAIERAATREEQVNKLLDIVSRQPDSAFTQLLDALKDTNQEQSALILSALIPSSKEEETFPQQPEAAWKTTQDSMRLLISKLPSVDPSIEAAVNNVQTTLSTMRHWRGTGTNVERRQKDETNAAEQHNIDDGQNHKLSEEARTNRISEKPTSVRRTTSAETNPINAAENPSCVVDILRYSDERVYGVTSLHERLFVLRADCIDIYATASQYALLERLNIPGLRGHEWNDLTASLLYNSLYIADCAERMIRAVELTRLKLTASVVEWKVPDCPCGVSVTPDNEMPTLLVTCADIHQLLELSLDDGDWLHRVELSSDIQRPLHAVKLTNGHYVVSHGSARGLQGQHRICVVDSTGCTIHSYGAQPGRGIGQLDWPCHMTIGKGEFVFVADSSNNRIKLLSPVMQLKREYVGCLSHPRRLHLDRHSERLYISDFGGRVVIVQLKDSTPCHRLSVRLITKHSRSAQCNA